jgi:hypothetical protein
MAECQPGRAQRTATSGRTSEVGQTTSRRELVRTDATCYALVLFSVAISIRAYVCGRAHFQCSVSFPNAVDRRRVSRDVGKRAESPTWRRPRCAPGANRVPTDGHCNDRFLRIFGAKARPFSVSSTDAGGRNYTATSYTTSRGLKSQRRLDAVSENFPPPERALAGKQLLDAKTRVGELSARHRLSSGTRG